MKWRAPAASVAALAVAACAASLSARWAAPPLPEQSGATETLHGVAVDDPFRGLEDLSAPAVQAWIAAEALHTERALRAVAGRAQLAARLAAHSGPSRSVPTRAGDAYYWLWNDGTREHAQLVRGATPFAHADVVLDPNGWRHGPGSSLAGLVFAPSGRRLVYGVTAEGSDAVAWHALDLATLAPLPCALPPLRYHAPAWDPSETGLYYAAPARSEGALRPAAPRTVLWHHTLGGAADTDTVVLDEPLHPNRSYTPAVTADGRWLVVTVHEGADPRSRVHFRDLSRPDNPFLRTLDAFDAEYELVASEGAEVWLRTTAGAPNGRIVRLAAAGDGTLSEVVPEAPLPLARAVRTGRWLVLEYLDGGASRLARARLDGTGPGEALSSGPLQGLGAVALPAGDARADAPLYCGYTDPLTPLATWCIDVDMDRAEAVFLPATALAHDRFTLRALELPSSDGVSVPVSLAHRRAFEAPAPCLVYVYGGFNVPVRPVHTPLLAVWLELGGALAFAHVRGGGERGEAWHHAGRRTGKQAAVEDVLAVTRGLTELGLTTAERCAVRGESNGGLIASAAFVRARGEIHTLVARAGLTDMLRYQRLGLGWAWSSEYGTADDASDFAALLAYSPYHNVAADARYGPALFVVAAADERVSPAHSYKLAARLRSASTHNGPVLLRLEAGAGHRGAALASERFATALDELCFLAEALKIDVRSALR